MNNLKLKQMGISLVSAATIVGLVIVMAALFARLANAFPILANGLIIAVLISVLAAVIYNELQ